MERLIIKESHISPPGNQEIGKPLIVLYAVNVVSKDLQSDLVCILITSRGDLSLTSTIFSMQSYIDMHIW
jgi:hypothetical protein